MSAKVSAEAASNGKFAAVVASEVANVVGRAAPASGDISCVVGDAALALETGRGVAVEVLWREIVDSVIARGSGGRTSACATEKNARNAERKRKESIVTLALELAALSELIGVWLVLGG